METGCCSCGGAITMLFACSGGSNVGQISNEVARRLTAENQGGMFCLAGLGGDIEPLVEKARAAGRILAIDGCPVACAKKTLDRHGIAHQWLELTSLGIEKNHEMELRADEVALAMNAAQQCLRA